MIRITPKMRSRLTAASPKGDVSAHVRCVLDNHDALVKALDAAIHVINIVRCPGSYTAENVLEDAERTFDKAVEALRASKVGEQDRVGGGEG